MESATLKPLDYLKSLDLDGLAQEARRYERDRTLAAFRCGRVFSVAQERIGVGATDAWLKKEGFARSTAYEDKRLYERLIVKFREDDLAEEKIKDLTLYEAKVLAGLIKPKAEPVGTRETPPEPEKEETPTTGAQAFGTATIEGTEVDPDEPEGDDEPESEEPTGVITIGEIAKTFGSSKKTIAKSLEGLAKVRDRYQKIWSDTDWGSSSDAEWANAVSIVKDMIAISKKIIGGSIT